MVIPVICRYLLCFKLNKIAVSFRVQGLQGRQLALSSLPRPPKSAFLPLNFPVFSAYFNARLIFTMKLYSIPGIPFS